MVRMGRAWGSAPSSTCNLPPVCLFGSVWTACNALIARTMQTETNRMTPAMLFKYAKPCHNWSYLRA